MVSQEVIIMNEMKVENEKLKGDIRMLKLELASSERNVAFKDFELNLRKEKHVAIVETYKEHIKELITELNEEKKDKNFNLLKARKAERIIREFEMLRADINVNEMALRVGGEHIRDRLILTDRKINEILNSLKEV